MNVVFEHCFDGRFSMSGFRCPIPMFDLNPAGPAADPWVGAHLVAWRCLSAFFCLWHRVHREVQFHSARDLQTFILRCAYLLVVTMCDLQIHTVLDNGIVASQV